MAKLIFKNEQMKKVIALNKASKEFHVNHGEVIDRWEKENKKRYDYVTEIPEAYYFSNKPTLMLVKDSGIYLMTGARMKNVPNDGSHICYAKGYDPTNEDVYDKCANAVGGDDFGEIFEIGEDLVTQIEKGADVIINITSKSFTVSTLIKK